MTILKDATHTAKKNHYCEECCGTIKAGEKYRMVSHIFEGDLCIYKAHLSCSEASIEANTLAKSANNEWFLIHKIPQNQLQFYSKAAAIFSPEQKG